MSIQKTRIGWAEFAAVVDDDVMQPIEQFKQGIQNGRIEAARWVGDRIDLYTATWVDGTEFVMAVAYGKGLWRTNMTGSLMDDGRAKRCATYRFHVKPKEAARVAPVARLARKAKPKLDELIYRGKL